MTLASDAFIEKNLELLIEAVDDLAVEQQKLAKHTHAVSKQQQQVQQWLARRVRVVVGFVFLRLGLMISTQRAENVSRKERGEKELPETEAAAVAALGPRPLNGGRRCSIIVVAAHSPLAHRTVASRGVAADAAAGRLLRPARAARRPGLRQALLGRRTSSQRRPALVAPRCDAFVVVAAAVCCGAFSLSAMITKIQYIFSEKT